MFWRMKDTPTAVISGASRGALRSGLYAMRSINAFATAKTGMVTASPSRRPPMITGDARVRIETEPDDHRERHEAGQANTSPCAKLMSCRIPYTSVYPSAMRP